MKLADLPRNKHGIPIMPTLPPPPRPADDRRRWDNPAVRYACEQRRRFKDRAEAAAAAAPGQARWDKHAHEVWRCPKCGMFHISGRPGDRDRTAEAAATRAQSPRPRP